MTAVFAALATSRALRLLRAAPLAVAVLVAVEVAVVELQLVVVAAAVAVAAVVRWRQINAHDKPWPYVSNFRLPGEASVTGLILLATSFGGGLLTPVDEVVTLNGVPLVATGQYYKVDPNAAVQPTLGPDNMLHIVVSSKLTKTFRELDLPCAPATMTTSPPAGSSLAGVSALDVSWTPLPPQGPNLAPPFAVPFLEQADKVALFALDLATETIVGNGSGLQVLQGLDPNTESGITVPVIPVNADGYMLELTYASQYILDGNSGGYCIVKNRVFFEN